MLLTETSLRELENVWDENSNPREKSGCGSEAGTMTTLDEDCHNNRMREENNPVHMQLFYETAVPESELANMIEG